MGAGGRPSGAPGYRNNDCSCFNAAVEDLDGNTIEFIFREGGAQHAEEGYAPSQSSKVLSWQNDVAREASVGARSQDSLSSAVSAAKSRGRTALDLASTTSKQIKSSGESGPMDKIKAAVPTDIAGISSKAVLGTMIGAAAGAAICYAFRQSERDNAQAEADHESFMASTVRGRDASTRGSMTRRSASAAPTRGPATKRSASAAPPRTAFSSHRNFSTTESVAPRSHRNFSVTDSRVTARPPPSLPPTTVYKAIEPRGYDDSEIQAAISQYTSRNRPAPSRSRTHDALDYAPLSMAGRSQHTAKRSATVAEQPRSERRGSTQIERHEQPQIEKREQAQIEPREQLYLEGPKSTASKRDTRRDSTLDDSGLRRHDSGISMHSHRNSRHAKRDDDDRRSSASQASTAKPSKKEESRYEPSVAAKSSKSSRSERSKHEGSRREPSVAGRSRTSRPDGERRGSRSEAAYQASKRDNWARTESPDSIDPRESRRNYDRDDDRRSRASTAKPARRESISHRSMAPSALRSASKAPSKPPSTMTEAMIGLGLAGAAKHAMSLEPESRSKAPSKAGSRIPTTDPKPASYVSVPDDKSRGPSRVPTYISAAGRPLPESRADSHVSKSAAGIPLPDTITGERGYDEPGYETDGLGDMKTVVPDDSISCIEPSVPKAPPSDHSHRSERSHRSHHAARSKHSRRPEEPAHDPQNEVTVYDEAPEAPRSEHSRHSGRSHRTHHTSRSKHSRRDEGNDREADVDKKALDENLESKTLAPGDSISSVGLSRPAPARSDHSHHSDRSHRSYHTSRSKRSHHPEEAIKEEDVGAIDTRTVAPEDSISVVDIGPQPARSEHSRHAHKSHHSSKSKHSRREDGEKDKDSKKAEKAMSETAKSTSTVKPAKSRASAATLPVKLREKEEKSSKSGKRSNASYA